MNILNIAVQEEIDSLIGASQQLHHYVDRVVAHYDTRGLEATTPKFDDLTKCLAILEKLVLRYLLLLKGEGQERLLPTFLYEWKSIFHIPWLL